MAKRFLMIARRWDTDVTTRIDFSHKDWDKNLCRLALTTGHLQIPDFYRLFCISKGLYNEVPPLIVGRSYWDHWLVWKALNEQAAVLDATHCIVAVHQNHGYGYHPLGKQGTNEDELAKKNIELAGNGEHLRTMLDSTHQLTRSGAIRRTRFRRIFESDALLKMRQVVADKTFWLRDRLGLRRAPLEKRYNL